MFVAFYLRHKINKIQENLAKTSLVIIHAINCLIVVCLLAVNLWTEELHNFNYVEETLLVVFGTYISLFKNYLIIKFAQNIQDSQYKDQLTGSQVPFDVFVENDRIIRSAYLTKVNENGKVQHNVKERLRIVRKRRSNNPSLASPTVVGILESYSNAIIMTSSSQMLSE